MRIIDADVLKKKAFRYAVHGEVFPETVYAGDIDKAPTVDAVPREEYERVCKERDAAIDTLEYLAFEQMASVHEFCKNWTAHGCCCYDEHGNIIHECPGWEWRGVTDDKL